MEGLIQGQGVAGGGERGWSLPSEARCFAQSPTAWCLWPQKARRSLVRPGLLTGHQHFYAGWAAGPPGRKGFR